MAKRILFILLTTLFMLLSTVLVTAQSGSGNAIAFSSYACSFVRAEGDIEIRAVLMGTDGRPLSRESYRVNVSDSISGQAIAPASIRTRAVSVRPPLRMIIALDVTETMPLVEIKEALADSLIPNLQLEDEVAMITFSSTVSETSIFLKDKNRLLNDYVVGLSTQLGDNRIYDALLQAVTALQDPIDDERRVILLITDSGRRSDDQAAIQNIIDLAQASHIQIYPIGFRTRDIPDVTELRRIARETYGYSWINVDEDNTRSVIQAFLTDYLNQFVTTLNSEINITVESPVASPETDGLALYDVALALRSGGILTTEATCPIDELDHSISFVTTDFNIVTHEAFEIPVTYESELNPSEVEVAFWIDDRLIVSSASTVFTFDTPAIQPGAHTLFAQLRDLNGRVLATTQEVITVYAQQQLRVEITGGSITRLDQPITFEVFASPDADLPQMGVYVPIPDNEFFHRIEELSIVDGVGAFTIRNLQERMLQIFPEAQDGQTMQLIIGAPSEVPGQPPLAQPQTYTFNFIAPEEPEPPRQPPYIFRIPYTTNQLMALFTFGLFIANIVLFLRIRRLRIKKLIHRPDDIELSDRLMTVTVRNDEEKKSYPLTKKTMTVGRGDTNDIDLGDSPHISRRHGVIIWRKGRWWYTNRKGSTVTQIEGQRVRGYGLKPLIPITELEFDKDTVMIFHSSAQQDVSALFNTDLD